ncbi:MAG TPA: hypothetical protein VG272_10760 [Candidatus Acidoferrales bacterium]|jgi:hypothetical protein|nr:hypothetical protein [Candidatus Acidoferrales bacterium]
MKYKVHLNIPTAWLGKVKVEADNPTDAGVRALEMAAKGDISFERPEVDYADAEIADVEESE